VTAFCSARVLVKAFIKALKEALKEALNWVLLQKALDHGSPATRTCHGQRH
jgi:hypothetical protein